MDGETSDKYDSLKRISLVFRSCSICTTFLRNDAHVIAINQPQDQVSRLFNRSFRKGQGRNQKLQQMVCDGYNRV